MSPESWKAIERMHVLINDDEESDAIDAQMAALKDIIDENIGEHQMRA